MKKVIILLALLTLGIGSFYAYKSHQRSTLIAQLTPMVKNASIRVTNSTKFDIESSHITYKELFDRADADTAEIEKRTVDMQSMSTAETAPVTDPAVAYMHDCQEVIRALNMKYRKQLAFSSALDSSRDAIQDMRTSTSYSFDFAKARAEKAGEAMRQAMEEGNQAATDLLASATKLKTSRAKVAALFQDDALITTKQIDALIDKNRKEVAATEAAKAKNAS